MSDRYNDTPLEGVPGWSELLVERAKRAWITSAEQVVAIAAIPDGLKSLREQLQVSELELWQLAQAARDRLSPAKQAELAQPVDTSEYGLGYSLGR